MKEVAIYLRVSSNEQAEKGWSIDGQYSSIRDYCDKQSEWHVSRVVKDPGFTATNMNRPGLQRLMLMAADGLLDSIVVWRFDRLARNDVDFPVILHYFRSKDVDVISATEPVDTSTPMGNFVIGVLGLMATMESRLIQMRSKMGLETRAKQGLWHGGKPPYGYGYNKETGRLFIAPEEAEVVRKIFASYLDKKCLYKTRAELKDLGLKTRGGYKWGVQAIRNVLNRDKYTGVMKHGEIVVPDETIRIIEPEVFVKTQKVLENEADLELLEVHPERLETVKHQFVGKKDNPACPECGLKRNVRKKGWTYFADGTKRKKFYCLVCNREFNPQTALIPIEPCPQCGKKQKVRCISQIIRDVHEFGVFNCRSCSKPFRVLRANYASSIIHRAVQQFGQ